MPPRVPPPLVEVFLLVEQPRQRLTHWSQALAPLDDPSAPAPGSVDAYYDPAASQAIFALRYDERSLTSSRLRHVVEVALLAEIGMIQPAELGVDDRRRFVTDRLAACTVRVMDQRTVVGALIELVRHVRTQRASSGPPALAATLLQRARPQVAPTVRARGDTVESPAIPAKGTRHPPNSEAQLPRSTRDLAFGSVSQPRIEVREAPPASAASAIEATPRPAMQRDEPPPRPSPHVISRSGVHQAHTVLMPTVSAQRMIEAARQPVDVEAPTEPAPLRAPPGSDPGTPRMISARYLRSGRWVPLRIGSLSLKGAALMAVALPRVDDRVDVALTYAGHRALVRGAVAKVSTMQEAETSGATMFSVNFELDDGSRRQLTALLTAARAANVTIKPAPPRGTRRYPVEWPVALGTARGPVRAEALDVSADGMFVRPTHPLARDARVGFQVVLEDSQTVAGHARVVRSITEADARTTGLLPGYGLAILEIASGGRELWSAFLSRVARRSAKRVFVAASATRLGELESGLVAGGYATTSGSEPSAIAQLVSAEARPMDAALIDATWLVTEGSTLWVESVFTSRKIPYVTVHGDARRARMAIDRLLSVV